MSVGGSLRVKEDLAGHRVVVDDCRKADGGQVYSVIVVVVDLEASVGVLECDLFSRMGRGYRIRYYSELSK